jgi:signal transduction histidine kinase
LRVQEDASQVALVVDIPPALRIDAADLPYVFDCFYRTDKYRNRASGGSGNGLALVKQLVEAHKGRVWVESAPGAGATFAVALPLPNAAKV